MLYVSVPLNELVGAPPDVKIVELPPGNWHYFYSVLDDAGSGWFASHTLRLDLQPRVVNGEQWAIAYDKASNQIVFSRHPDKTVRPFAGKEQP